MLILGLDFETTGLESETDRVIEIGAVLWDTKRNMPVSMLSELVKPKGLEEISETTTQLTGITLEDLERFGCPTIESFNRLNALIEKADYIVAHNAKFDRSFYLAECDRLQIPAATLSWIDTTCDILFPNGIQTRKLLYLAAEHQISNAYPHRAIFDALTMMSILAKYDIDEVILRSKSPTLKVFAEVTYEERELAKAHQFYWSSTERKWHRVMKECDLESMKFPFQVAVTSLA